MVQILFKMTLFPYIGELMIKMFGCNLVDFNKHLQEGIETEYFFTKFPFKIIKENGGFPLNQFNVCVKEMENTIYFT